MKKCGGRARSWKSVVSLVQKAPPFRGRPKKGCATHAGGRIGPVLSYNVIHRVSRVCEPIVTEIRMASYRSNARDGPAVFAFLCRVCVSGFAQRIPDIPLFLGWKNGRVHKCRTELARHVMRRQGIPFVVRGGDSCVRE